MFTDSGSSVLVDTSGVDQEVVLDSLRAFHVEEVRREQGMVLLAVQWVRLNPGPMPEYPGVAPVAGGGDDAAAAASADSGTPGVPTDDAAGASADSAGIAAVEDDSNGLLGVVLDVEDEVWVELAERGCPPVDDLTIPVFATAAGLSEFQARKLIRESLMLVFLLPKVWDRVIRGQVQVWRARKLAEECWGLSPEAIGYVDAHMSMVTARHTQGGREGIINEARHRLMAGEVAAEQEAAKEQRGFEVSTEDWAGTGVAGVFGALDLVDAIDLEAAVAAGAETLKDLGSDAPLPVRRAWALGDLARASQQPLTPPPLSSSSPGSPAGLPAGSVGVAFGVAVGGEGFLPGCACQQGHSRPDRHNRRVSGAGGAGPPNVSGYPGWEPSRVYWNGKGTASSRVVMYLHVTPRELLASGFAPGQGYAHLEGSTTDVKRFPTGEYHADSEQPPMSQGTAMPTTTDPIDSSSVHNGASGDGGAHVVSGAGGDDASSISAGEGASIAGGDASGIASDDAPGGGGVVRVEGSGVRPGLVLTPATVREWFTRPRSTDTPVKVIFRPVIDLEDHLHADAYEVPTRVKEQVGLRDGGCVFPWCCQKVWRTDCDHTIPWAKDGTGGPTCSCNLAPLCRFHHRAKTHADNTHGNVYTWWRYEQLGEGKFLWTGPAGTKLLRTNAGVYDITAEHRSTGPRTPDAMFTPRTITDITTTALTDRDIAKDTGGDEGQEAHDSSPHEDSGAGDGGAHEADRGLGAQPPAGVVTTDASTAVMAVERITATLPNLVGDPGDATSETAGETTCNEDSAPEDPGEDHPGHDNDGDHSEVTDANVADSDADGAQEDAHSSSGDGVADGGLSVDEQWESYARLKGEGVPANPEPVRRRNTRSWRLDAPSIDMEDRGLPLQKGTREYYDAYQAPKATRLITAMEYYRTKHGLFSTPQDNARIAFTRNMAKDHGIEWTTPDPITTNRLSTYPANHLTKVLITLN